MMTAARSSKDCHASTAVCVCHSHWKRISSLEEINFKMVVNKKGKYEESFQCSWRSGQWIESRQSCFSSTLHWVNCNGMDVLWCEEWLQILGGWMGRKAWPETGRSNNQGLARYWMEGKELAVTWKWCAGVTGSRELLCRTRRKSYLEWEGQDFRSRLVEQELKYQQP